MDIRASKNTVERVFARSISGGLLKRLNELVFWLYCRLLLDDGVGEKYPKRPCRFGYFALNCVKKAVNKDCGR